MKKLLLLFALSLLAIEDAKCIVHIATIWIGGESKDGSGWDTPWGTVSWGGGCKDGIGMCIEVVEDPEIINNNSGELEAIEIFEDMTMEITLTNAGNIDALDSYILGQNVVFDVNSPIAQGLTSQYAFLDPQGMYFVPKGSYSYTTINDKVVLTVQIAQIQV